MTGRPRVIIFCIIFLLALFFRTYRISDLTEFLGDQGSATSVILTAYTERSLPLHGPAVSTGQYPGPFYYYMIALPLMASGFNPLYGAITAGLFGALSSVLLVIIAIRFFSPFTAALLGVLYAVSPLLVRMERTMWNPSFIPAFFLLGIYAMQKLDEDKDIRFGALLFASGGILIQLHYSNMFVLAVFTVFFALTLIRRRGSLGLRGAGTGIAVSVCALVLVLLPFIVFESGRRFSDLSGVLAVYSGSRDHLISLSSRIIRLMELNTEQWRFVSPVIDAAPALLLFGLSAALLLKRRDRVLTLLFLSYVTARFIESGHLGRIHTHYQLYTAMIPFILLGSLLSSVRSRYGRLMALAVFVPFLLGSVKASDFRSPGNRDLARVESAVRAIRTDAASRPFAFTVIHSRSYSDYHYRFYFERDDIPTVPADSADAQLLYLICDDRDCPDDRWMREQMGVYILCYDHHCRFEYPSVSLLPYTYLGRLDTGESVVYKFVK